MMTIGLRLVMATLDPLHAAHCAAEHAGWRCTAALRSVWLLGLTLAADLGGAVAK
mgnify:CR=1 FL=1